ncbi:MAG: GAF domain-containing protein [Deltaproteobacteria bacterium]|nr:GAF domain-containing protein [Deltaproteobacteria bacterium]
MATLISYDVENGENARFAVFKSLTTIGSDPDVDVIVDGLAKVAAHILYDGKTFTISTTDKRAEIAVSGNRVRKQTLVDGDEIEIGNKRFRFALADKKNVVVEEAAETEQQLEALRRLLDFSRVLGNATDVPALLDRLMDEIIGISRAAKGFLVLLEDGKPSVKVARNLKGQGLDAAVAELSDTILAKVIHGKKPIVVSNALEDTEFNSSLSVVNLKLTSVMCAPLLHQGELFGAIYVGNNSVVNLFDDTSLELLTIFCGQASLLVQQALAMDALSSEAARLRQELSQNRYGDLIGSCQSMKDIFKKIDKVSKADISVLVTGETGTGKELIAREIHRRSPRKKGNFEVINCGAIPENLLESELFGHVKGAFTGATANKPGRFHMADGGTLFLDEIGEMPLNLQVKILRALQEKQVMRVGGSQIENVDIRVVTATHRDLKKMVEDGEFREDLYYRLNVVQLHLPPLRDRGEDVVVIATFLLKKYADEYQSKVRTFSAKGISALRKYGWPGNVRQLENRIKRALVLVEKKQITPEDLDISIDDLAEVLPIADAVERFRRRYINESLDRNGNNRTKTAKELGVDPRTIFRHLEQERTGEDSTDTP